MQHAIVMGPSGAGKSTLSAAYATDSHMLHIEADNWPENGIDDAGIRQEWDAFYGQQRPEPLVGKLSEQATLQGFKGVVLSLPSSVVLSLELLKQSRIVGVEPFILWGNQQDCLLSFLNREQSSGRNLSADHWAQNNERIFAQYSDDGYSCYLIQMFNKGIRRQLSEIVAEMQVRLVF